MAQFGQTFYTKDLPSEYLYNKYFNSSNSFKMHNQGHKIDAEHIKAELLSGLRGHLKTFYPNGKIKGNSFYIGNIHGDKGESLVITLSGRYAGKGKDFATGESFDIFALFAHHFNLNTKTQFYQLLQRLSEYLGLSQSENKPLTEAEIQNIKAKQEQAKQRQIAEVQEAILEREKKQENALKLWNEAICINEPTAQEYLTARGLDIKFNMHVMRYLPEAWHRELRMNLPCLIALVTDTKGTPYILNNGKPLIGQNGQEILEYKPIGIERHYLPPETQTTPEAYKKWFTDKGVSRRKILGSKKRGVVMLNGFNTCHERLILTEGIITAYSIMFNVKDSNCTITDTSNPLGAMYWAFLGVNNLEEIIIPSHIKEIIYFMDNDKAGEKSKELLKQNNSVKGRNSNDLKITTKKIKLNNNKDLNDLITKKSP